VAAEARETSEHGEPRTASVTLVVPHPVLPSHRVSSQLVSQTLATPTADGKSDGNTFSGRPSASSRLEFGVVCHWLSEPFKGFNCQKSPWRAEPVQDSTDGMARCGTLNSKLDKTLGSIPGPRRSPATSELVAEVRRGEANEFACELTTD
jgi:hypothetical protein